ncbi:LacI family DNA-binding transcriptional regulator [Arthrobacter sp. APC 3897]|uniref:LacI family DNA-binding transcriptional regulator n=1 Tax=Arthrobacter sp. APC 3897 TaxID=3035204 RepID=UPI0025B36D44|nr:LacI family DNA-binding transcriptional regulator [Arthrobacter sp. APC 3897]MDN3483351.1 LacI family DNA-binding transcriptional regulator [Arthrobacter sp. APC 3897]
MKRVGIKEVAERAGVSWKTVSNVMNNRPVVHPETRARVLQAVEELGYTPNLIGRQLRQGSTRAIALVVPDLHNPYFGVLAQTLESAAKRRGYTISIEISGGTVDVEQHYLQGWHGRLFDGLIFSPSAVTAEAIAKRTDPAPLVLLGERIINTDVPHVAIDNVASSVDLVRHLVEGGRRRIAFLGADRTGGISTGSQRFEGYKAALRFANLPYEESLVAATSSWFRQDGYELTQQILSGHGVDAIVCANDLLAVGALAAARDLGRRVPADLALVGWDNIDEVRYTSPGITSVAPDLEALAEAALSSVLGELDGEVVIPHRVVERASSAPADPATV